MGSKYVDLVIAVFMGIFAYTRFAAEQYGFAVLFIILCIANLVVFYLKHQAMKQKSNDASSDFKKKH